MQSALHRAEVALPSSGERDAFDFQAGAAQEKELLTPKKRLRWDHVHKLYMSILIIRMTLEERN